MTPLPDLTPTDTPTVAIDSDEPLGRCADCGRRVTAATFAAAYATGDVLCRPCFDEFQWPHDGDLAGCVG